VSAPFSVVLEPSWVRAVVEEPWDVARAVAARFSSDVATIERQPIRAIAGGRSFASNDGPAPFHTDSQLHRGRPAHLQVLFCVRPATSGGTSLVADTHTLLDEVAHTDPALHDALFRTPRSFPFVFGDFVASTVAAVERDLFFTHSPRANDPIGAEVARHLERIPLTRIDLRQGEVLIVDNHRCLHGRTAFGDRTRELQRLLIWLTEPPAVDEERRARALREGHAPRRTGVAPAIAAIPPEHRRALVEEMRRGVAPGFLAAEHQMPEAFLYVFRDEYTAPCPGPRSSV